jgi:hypothetical protein
LNLLSLGLDIAERHSAACLLDDAYNVVGEHVLDAGGREDPWPLKLQAVRIFIKDIIANLDESAAADYSNVICHIESVPPRAYTVRPAQIQGAVMLALHVNGVVFDHGSFVTPGKWQSFFGYSRKKAQATQEGRGKQTTKGWAKQKCLEFGFNPESSGTQNSKVKIDVRDAYLIARYGLETEGRRRLKSA